MEDDGLKEVLIHGRENTVAVQEATMRFLPPEDVAIVCHAQKLCLPEAFPSPAYLCPNWCMALTLVLALPTFGYSFVFVPILWVIQHDRTANRLTRLRLELNRLQSLEVAG
jgi:nitrate reductase beta subunit